MSITFAECTNLKTAPIVPASVTSLSQAFRECTNLTGTVIINASNLISTNEDAFNRVNFATQNITLAGESTILDLIGSSGQNYCAECNGTCQGNH